MKGILLWHASQIKNKPFIFKLMKKLKKRPSLSST